MVDEIAGQEPKAERSLMHRFNIALARTRLLAHLCLCYLHGRSGGPVRAYGSALHGETRPVLAWITFENDVRLGGWECDV
jgi:hypothetical protein